MTDRIMRRREVEHATGKSRSSIYDAIQRGDFPAPRRISGRTVGWRESEIQEWIESRPRCRGEVA